MSTPTFPLSRQRFILFSIDFFYYRPRVTDEVERQLQSLADAVAKRGLCEPAIFFLEMFKPLAGCARELFVFGGPLPMMLFGAEWGESLKTLLSSSECIETLIGKLEATITRSDASFGI